jgi:flagella basal body P-ring formation protein FlgA
LSGASFAAGFALALAFALPASAQDFVSGPKAPVPRVTIYPGDVISDELLIDRELARETVESGAVFADRRGLIGKVARQTLVAGNPIAHGAVRDAPTIKQGQPTRVLYQDGALSITTTAVSLQAGTVGDMISLRNSDSGTTIRGVVQADGSVRIGLP